MSTPQPDTAPAASVINWYFGPTAWDQRPDAMWHAQCPDPYATGHDGEVWLDHHKGAFCTGCRHFEPGQAEVDIPAQRLAEIPPQPKPWEPQTSLTAGYLAATQAVIGQTASTMPELPPEVESLDPTTDQPYTLTQTTETSLPASPDPVAATSSADTTPEETAATASNVAAVPGTPAERPGLLTRIKDAIEGAAEQPPAAEAP